MYKRNIIIPVLFIMIIGIGSFKNIKQQRNEPWKQNQLIEPSSLAAIINNPSAKQPIIYSIGFGDGVKNSIIEGPVKDSVNLLKWKNELEKLPRNAKIVIYCGCCPFEHCPNIRPAFKLLNEMGFTNQKLLDLSHNLKADWIDKGYPVNDILKK
jgi:thiosulfate/3-mercaptopyruvate sulfurtransferase